MDIKKVRCSICNQEVNKVQTYYVGDGKRACRAHEGVQKKRDQLEAERQQKLERVVRNANRPDPPPGFMVNTGEAEGLKPICFLCRKPGMRHREFFLRFLVEQEKAVKIYGPFNPFDPNHPGNKIQMPEPCIFIIEAEKVKHIRWKYHQEFRDIMNFAGITAICGPCCAENKIDPLPKIDMDQLVKFIPVSEAFIRPVLEKLAARELGRDN